MLAEAIPRAAGATDRQYPYYPRPSLIKDRSITCKRQLTYWALSYPRTPMPGRAILTMDDSSWHEELTNDWIRKTGAILHSEQMGVDIPASAIGLDRAWYCRTCKRTMPRGILHGHIDGIVNCLQGEWFGEWFYEHKAINHYAFQRYWAEDIPDGYLGQSCLYLKGIRDIAPLERGILLVKNKNTAQYVEFLFHYNAESDTCWIKEKRLSTGETVFLNYTIPDITASALSLFREIAEYRHNHFIPPRDFDFGTKFPCEYCGWYRTCWAGFQEEIGQLEKKAELDEEMETLCGFYLENKFHAEEAEKQAKELRSQILGILTDKNVAGGTAGKYVVYRTITKRTSIDRQMIPEEILQKALKPSATEMLIVRNRRDKK